MTERAQKIWEAYEAEHFTKDGVAAVIREIVNEYQYHHFGEGEDMVVDARVLYELADELEAL